MSTAVTVGTFDGVHIGHRDLVEHTVSLRPRSVVLVFEDTPRVILKNASIPYLSTLDERLRQITALGADQVVPLKFEELRFLTADDFLKLIKERHNASAIALGNSTRIGSDRLNGDALGAVAAARGMEYKIVPNRSLPGMSAKVSSTAVRAAVQKGDLDTANKMLGRRFALSGKVVRGKQRGRDLKYPTANLRPADYAKLVVPPDGVYAAYAEFNGQTKPAAVSIGTNPTFKDEARSIEAHILNYSGDLYGANLKLNFAKLLRPQHTYNTPQALQKQMGTDISQVQTLTNNEFVS